MSRMRTAWHRSQRFVQSEVPRTLLADCRNLARGLKGLCNGDIGGLEALVQHA